MAFESDIVDKPDGAYRIVVWSLGSSIDRKYGRIIDLEPDYIITARGAAEARLLKAGRDEHSSMAWVGRFPQRGLGAISFGSTYVKLNSMRWDQRLEWIAPIIVNGPIPHNLLAVWALNEKARVSFKSNPAASQPIQMLNLYRKILTEMTVVAGDFNNNPVFHRNDPNWDMLEVVARLEATGLLSAYHAFNGLDHGDPREQATRFTPVRELGQVAHHTDYCFIPSEWFPALLNVQVGSPEVWFNQIRSEEHVPVVVDFDTRLLRDLQLTMRDRKAPARPNQGSPTES